MISALARLIARRRNPGDWRGLRTAGERPRYQAISAMVEELQVSNVLDVGCAEGLLRAWLPQTVKYHGIESSYEACQRARERLPADAIVNVMG